MSTRASQHNRTTLGIGTIVGGRYALEEVAGRGGMATVWRGRVVGAHGFRRAVALKQMHAHLAERPFYVEMFCEEARIGASLSHPNIAQIYDFAEQGEHYYLIMEWVDGIDLGTYVRYVKQRGGRIRWELATAIGIGVLRGLTAAHERVTESGLLSPVVHRDISPHNVLLGRRGIVKIIDFGLSLAYDRRSELTEPGVVKGKMSYLSPEVVHGGRPSPATDQYAVGAVLWEILAGRRLFEAPTDFEIFQRIRAGEIEPLAPLRPDAPEALIAIVERALSRDPRGRFPSAAEMCRQLGTVLERLRVRKDLHATLGRVVREIQQAVGHRLDDSGGSLTPVTGTTVDGEAPIRELARGGLRHRLRMFMRGA